MDTAGQRAAKARAGFEAKQREVLERITQGDHVAASFANATALISHGHVSEGVEMVDYLLTASLTSVTPADILSVLHSLTLPAVCKHFYTASDHKLLEAYKLLGNIKATQRTREADHFFGVLKKLKIEDSDLQVGYQHLMQVYLTSGYDSCLQVPDVLYDRMFVEHIAPTFATYNAVLMALGAANRMGEFDALWSWLRYSSGSTPPLSSYKAALRSFLEAERFIEVEKLYFDMKSEESGVLPDAECLDLLISSYYEHSRHVGGTVHAAEEKKLIFIKTYARQTGVLFEDLSQRNKGLVEAALKRWTHKRGLDKTVREMMDRKKAEYEAWNEGQRWTHIIQDEINTSMIESGVRKMRGGQIDERMRLDVQKGGGRGVIYPPAPVKSVTRFVLFFPPLFVGVAEKAEPKMHPDKVLTK